MNVVVDKGSTINGILLDHTKSLPSPASFARIQAHSKSHVVCWKQSASGPLAHLKK